MNHGRKVARVPRYGYDESLLVCRMSIATWYNKVNLNLNWLSLIASVFYRQDKPAGNVEDGPVCRRDVHGYFSNIPS